MIKIQYIISLLTNCFNAGDTTNCDGRKLKQAFRIREAIYILEVSLTKKVEWVGSYKEQTAV